MHEARASRLADPAYLRAQYSDEQKLRIRIETHERYSENRMPFTDWVLERVDARPGQRLLDVGSGHGQYHDRLDRVRIVALDRSAGMLENVTAPRVQADAQALPFADGSFDRAMANHVLYHVADIPRALREIARVARPGGRVVITTNGRGTMRPLWDMADAVADEIGVPRYSSVALRFALEDLDAVRSVLPAVQVELYEDAFVFPSPTPVLAYVASMWTDFASPEARAEFLRRLEHRIAALIERHGVFRVPKLAGCFVADL